MNLLMTTLATAIFEIRRSLSIQRMLVASVLAGFPPAMLTIIGLSGEEIGMTDLLIVMLVLVVSILAQLLWATSNVYTELEAKSWIFLASRPSGRAALYLGKYLAAVTFSFAVCFVAITACLVLRTGFTRTMLPFDTWVGMQATALLSCACYSAVLSLIGTLFQKRAMVFGAAYIILSDFVIANIPAVIGQFTVRYHLQSISAWWIGWYFPIPEKDYVQTFGELGTWSHLTYLLVAIPVLLYAGCFVITSRQYITADET